MEIVSKMILPHDELLNGGREKREDIEIVAATASLAITEPDINDHDSRDKKVYMTKILNKYTNTLTKMINYHIGYPANLDFDYGALTQLHGFFLNNVGDPFIDGNYAMHSREFEVAVLDWFANLWEIQKNDYWGYVTVGGTEGNLHGILIGREVLPDGILYTSRESHYSIFKTARMYKMDCVKIDTLFTGEIDYEDLRDKLLRNKDKPAIINVNLGEEINDCMEIGESICVIYITICYTIVGTTVKGAVDNIDTIIQTLIECEFSHDRFYIHCDGALFGIMMPFVEHALRVSFKKPIGSVTISGHKFLGCPMPCGIYITRMQYINTLAKNIEYIGSSDTTIMGSRSGHTPIFLWYTINLKGYTGFKKEVERCLTNARYLKERLVKEGISVMLNELSNTVVFERPLDNEDFVHRWQLACEKSMAHVIVMPNITIEKLDEFLDEFVKKRSEWYKLDTDGGGVRPPCLADDIGGDNCLCPLHK